jgi:hypothetical protein
LACSIPREVGIRPRSRVRAVYEQRSVEAVRRYGQRLAGRIRARLELIPEILAKYATFPVLSAPN